MPGLIGSHPDLSFIAGSAATFMTVAKTKQLSREESGPRVTSPPEQIPENAPVSRRHQTPKSSL